MKTKQPIRQGDVLLVPVATLPKNCTPMEPENGRRFVLAHGEVTGHAHAIYEFGTAKEDEANAVQAAALAIADAFASAAAQIAIGKVRSMRTAQMWICPAGEWYLEIKAPAVMRHEEHTAPTIPPGVYHAPIQVAETVANMPRRVAD
jgi:hypothetical protein